MAEKKDIQRIVQKGNGVSISSSEMASAEDNQRLEIGFPAEKVTLVTTGNLQATVTPKVGKADANSGIAATTTAGTTVTSNLFSAVEITWTSGTGKVLVLAR